MTTQTLLFHWVFPIIALVYVVGYSTLFEPVRKWRKLPAILKALLDCPMCTGFWMGVLVGTMNMIPVAWPPWAQMPVLGGLSAIAIQYLIEVFGRT